MPALSGEWLEALQGEFKQPYYKKLFQTVNEEYRTYRIFPPADDIFNAFHYTPLGKVKVVIFGQDPYHGENQAHGLCFSVKPGVDIPPSLVNIYKELQDELGCYIPNHGNLTKWAQQGVLLLNSVLTVEKGKSFSHKNKGWEEFTHKVIQKLADKKAPIVFLLWGNGAKSIVKDINLSNHYVLTCAHPSPLSAYNGFFGCGHFKKCNEFLIKNNLQPIDWQIENI